MIERRDSSSENPRNKWRGLSMYQVYPRSFQDTNGDGVGDLQGIRNRLPYLKTLGIDALWVNPIFKSPGIEGGYDVSDYRVIDPSFGTMEDCDGLIADAHKSGMKIVFDLVINHTSNEHAWFKESKRSRDNSKADWYVYRDPKPDGSAPNNWVGNFGGSAWEFIPERGQYVLNTFLPEQKDLNYQNPEVLKAMGDNMRFWFDRGVDGMRLDALPFVSKDPNLPDGKLNPDFKRGDHPSKRILTDANWFQPNMLDILKYFNGIAEQEYDGKFVISEAFPPPNLEDKWVPFLYQSEPGNIHAPFNSAPIGLPWQAKAFGDYVTNFYSKLRPEDTAIWTLDSHDVYQRLASRIGDAQARVAAMWLLATPGIPVIYYGDEIGMKSHDVPINKQRDVFRRFDPHITRTKDPSRLPMPWDDSQNAGFTTGTPWLPIPPDYRSRNVRSQMADRNSLFHLYKSLLDLRQSSSELATGQYEPLENSNEQVFAYSCVGKERRSGVILNFSGEEQKLHLKTGKSVVVMDTAGKIKPGSDLDTHILLLMPDEGLIVSFS